MKKTNALKLRQNLGAILRQLEKEGQPILVEKNSKPAAVLISLEDYKKRFADRDADEMRRKIMTEIVAENLELPKGKSSLDLILELRK